MSDLKTVDERLFEAARSGDVATLTTLLDAYPEKLGIREPPYEGTLLHLAARHLPAVELLLSRGIDPNARDRGDNTYAMHWAAAAAELGVVRRLADAGGDVVGHGDDHALDVIGWATCWPGGDDVAHRAVADFLVSRGAKHHIFSAIALDLPDEVRRIVASDPSAISRRMSRNENNQLPLHFAVRMRRPAMVALLTSLGADSLGVDSFGKTFAVYAETTDIDRAAMERVAELTRAELASAARGNRQANVTAIDLTAALSLREWDIVERIVRDDASVMAGREGGVLHIMAKRGDLEAVRWLLDRGVDPNGLWMHFDAAVTPLHLAILADHADVARALLDAGADVSVRDSRHDGDALSWAEFFERASIAEMLRGS
jgi:ankyrin repeat protein